MNILYVNTYYHGGGAEKVMRQLYQGLKREDIHTFCLVGRYQGNIPDDVKVVYKGFTERALTTTIGTILGNTLISTRKARKEIIKQIKENKIDIVHFHNIHSNYFGIKDIREIMKHCPNIVITLHDMWMITGGCAHAFECEKWKEQFCWGCEGNVALKRFWMAKYLLEKKKEFFSDQGITFVTPSFWLQKQCEQSYLKQEKVDVIYNGISLNQFVVHEKSNMKKKYGLPTDKHILLFVANGINNIYKGFDYLVKALLALHQKEKYVLVVVGNKDDADLQLPFDIRMMGYISSTEKLNEIYSAADLFILPSMADTSPFTAMEAMASGTPVLAFHTGGIPEVVSESTGWIVEKKSAEALAEQIDKIFDDINKNDYEKKCNNCRGRIEHFFDEKRMLKNYEKLYSDIMLSNKR